MLAGWVVATRLSQQNLATAHLAGVIFLSVECRSVMRIVAATAPMYSGADKSLARPGRKQATATEDFVFNISYL